MSHPVVRELTYHRYLRERLEAAFPDADEETTRRAGHLLPRCLRLTESAKFSRSEPLELCFLRGKSFAKR